MKYLGLDTNVFINMIVSRDRGHKPESYDNMMKLLNYGEIRLVLPEIIITEVERNLEREVEKTYKKLNEVKKKIKDLYWINKVKEMERFEELKKSVTSNINQLKKQYELNKDVYLQDAKSLLNEIFYHSNTIIIKETDEVIKKAYRRQLYKKKPFNANGKDSLADAVIIESLISFISEKDKKDELIFISNNKADFSSDSDENILHKDIQEDIDKVNLGEQFHYSLYFTQTLVTRFEEETDNAGIKELLMIEAEYEEEFERASFNRQQVGLTPLTADWEEKVANDPDVYNFTNKLLEYHEEIATQYNSLVDDYESFKDYIESLSIEKLEEVLKCLNIVLTHSNRDEFDIQKSIMESVIEKIGIDLEDLYNQELSSCEDYFDLNSTLFKLKDFKGNSFTIEVKGDIFPVDDGEDCLVISVNNSITDIDVKGYIDIHYGYMDIDDEGIPGDGFTEQIIVQLDNVVSIVKEVSESIIDQIKDCKEKLNVIADII
ncbi:PIN domain-containing protein [Bacillus safensis]|uniref:PIN domain-containing protein n=1 Tax=Bacillus safensis TaxID=561879 RepID=UPI00381688FD